jgi:hypothetical protein
MSRIANRRTFGRFTNGLDASQSEGIPKKKVKGQQQMIWKKTK